MRKFATLAVAAVAVVLLAASYFAVVRQPANAQAPAVAPVVIAAPAPTYPTTPAARQAAKLEQQRIDTENARAIAQIRANARAAAYEEGQQRMRAYKLRLAQERAAQGR